MKHKRLRDIIEYETGLNIYVNTRRREYVQARAMYYYILRKETKMSLQAISETVKKNHATILHSINNFDDWMAADPELNKSYKRVLKSFFSSGDINNTSPKVNGEIIESLINENQSMKKKLSDMSKEIHKARKNPLVDLVYDVPQERQEEAYNRIDLMIKGWAWKYEDKCEIIGGFNSVDAY